jgi:hypothetical protein
MWCFSPNKTIRLLLQEKLILIFQIKLSRASNKHCLDETFQNIGGFSPKIVWLQALVCLRFIVPSRPNET